MYKQFRCPCCNHRLFDVTGGEPTTALVIKCSKCNGMISFDFRHNKDNNTNAPIVKVEDNQTSK